MSARSAPAVPPLPRFRAWLRKLAPTQAKRATLIGVSPRCVEYWLNGKRWPTVSMLRDYPDGLRALADDLEATNGHG